MGGDGPEELTTAQTSLNSAESGSSARLLHQQPHRQQQQMRRRLQPRQQVLDDSLAAIVQRLKEQHSAQSLPAFSHLKAPQQRKSL